MYNKLLILSQIVFILSAIQAAEKSSSSLAASMALAKREATSSFGYHMTISEFHRAELKTLESLSQDQVENSMKQSDTIYVSGRPISLGELVEIFHKRNFCLSDPSKLRFQQIRREVVSQMDQGDLDVSVSFPEGLSIGSVALLNGDIDLFELWLSRNPTCKTFFNKKSVLHILAYLNAKRANCSVDDILRWMRKIMIQNPDLIKSVNDQNQTFSDLLRANTSLTVQDKRAILRSLSDEHILNPVRN